MSLVFKDSTSVKPYGTQINPSIAKHLHNNQSVLEFGPGQGSLTYHLKQLNCDVTIVEHDIEMANLAGQWANETIIADLDTENWILQLGTKKFDTIIFADVLEHVRDPWSVLKKSANFLKPAGQILLSIPNIAHNAAIMTLLKNRFDYHEWGILDETHIRFFTRSGIEALITQAGLIPTHVLSNSCFPKDTGIKTDYREFPLLLSYYLNKRKYGHVLQFVYRAVHKNSAHQIDAPIHEDFEFIKYSFFKILRKRMSHLLRLRRKK